jgi:hypothetical protein
LTLRERLAKASAPVAAALGRISKPVPKVSCSGEPKICDFDKRIRHAFRTSPFLA